LEVFIVLYSNMDASDGHLCDEKMKLWWSDCGRQRPLRHFYDAEQLISFNQNLNKCQLRALERFTGQKSAITKQPKKADSKRVNYHCLKCCCERYQCGNCSCKWCIVPPGKIITIQLFPYPTFMSYVGQTWIIWTNVLFFQQ
jgi:hypothetical protein